MKVAMKLVFALGVVTVALSLTAPVTAVPEDPPEGNVCICHNTQQNKLDPPFGTNEQDPNENQKFVLICVNEKGKGQEGIIEKHLAHGDFLADAAGGCAIED